MAVYYPEPSDLEQEGMHNVYRSLFLQLCKSDHLLLDLSGGVGQ